MSKIRLAESQLHNVIRRCMNEALRGDGLNIANNDGFSNEERELFNVVAELIDSLDTFKAAWYSLQSELQSMDMTLNEFLAEYPKVAAKIRECLKVAKAVASC